LLIAASISEPPVLDKEKNFPAMRDNDVTSTFANVEGAGGRGQVEITVDGHGLTGTDTDGKKPCLIA